MNKLFSATGLAVIAWLSTFVMIWLILAGKIPITVVNILFWAFFVLVSVFSSAIASNRLD